MKVAASNAIEIVSRDPCHDWPLGECKHGNECAREHHSNLDSALIKNKHYSVLKELNDACQKCMQRMYQSTKTNATRLTNEYEKEDTQT